MAFFVSCRILLSLNMCCYLIDPHLSNFSFFNVYKVSCCRLCCPWLGKSRRMKKKISFVIVWALLARLLILVIWQHVLAAYEPYSLINLLLNRYKSIDLKMVFWIRCRKGVSLCKCQIFCRKITQTRLFDELCWKKTRKWPSPFNETFSYFISGMLYQTYYT